MKWYYADKGQQIGPVTEEEFQTLVAGGTIQQDTLVWNETMTEWSPYANVGGSGELTQKIPGAPFKNCAECGSTFSQADMINYENSWVCASCKPVFIQKIKEGLNVGGMLLYAGFWIRFGAQIIDYIVLWIVQMIIYVPVMIWMGFRTASMASSGNGSETQDPLLFASIQIILMILQMAINVAYETWFIGKYGATPGKMACKLQAVTSDGGKITYLRAFGRYFAKIISGIILCIGYIMAAFDGQKRTLHDHICDTRVVYKT